MLNFDYSKTKLWRIRPFSSYFCSLVLQQDSIVLQQDSILLQQDSIVVWEDSTVVWEDSTVVWEDSTVVWEDSIVVWEENCVLKITVFPDEKYCCQVWKFVIHKKNLPEKSKKNRKTFFCRVCIFPQGPFFSRKMRKNILPCVHFPAGAFFGEKEAFSAKL